jgi:hypothetical protein
LLQTDMSVINVALARLLQPAFFQMLLRFYGRTPYRERGIPVTGRFWIIAFSALHGRRWLKAG